MASLYKKVISGKPYWYLREMGWVDGKPKLVSERYLGTAADIEALLDAREASVMPERTRHLAFGDVAAAWGMLDDLGVAAIIDEAAGARRADAGASAGTYLVLAALNRLVAPCSKLAFADWWKATAAGRFTKIPASVLDHRRFWDAMHAVTLEQLEQASRAIAVRIVQATGVDCSSVALDMTNFATFIDTGNQKAPIAQRGKAKQKRADLRLVGLGLVVTRDGGIPLTWHAYPGDRPDVTQFPGMIDQLKTRYEAVCAAAGLPAGDPEMTVVFDAGQNSAGNFAHLAGTGLHYIGSVPASDCPDLTALPASVRRIVDKERFGGLTAYDTRREVYGAGRVRRVITWQLDGGQPKDLRLTWTVDPGARTALEEEIFGKHVLITDHDDWPVPEVIAGYRSQSEAEFSFRQMKDTRVVSFSPVHHWTEHNIRVHVFTCVLALQLAHLMRRTAARAGLRLSARELLASLAGIGETVLIYPSASGRPKARRMTTELSEDQRRLYEIFSLDRWAPRKLGHRCAPARHTPPPAETLPRSTYPGKSG